VLHDSKTQRMTHQRRVILEVIQGSSDHPTADEVYQRVRKMLPHISLGTVYRNLDVLAKNGMISKIGPEFTQMRYDRVTTEHYHITCIACGRIEDMPLEARDSTVERLESALGKLTKYGVFGHRLEFFGLCEHCKRERGDFLKEAPMSSIDEDEEVKDHGPEGE
jgi:Fur family ferric uptake transcriptional regulator